MSEELKTTCQDDEIDLFKLIEILWKDKALIIMFTVASTMVGTGYASMVLPEYLVSVNYTSPRMLTSNVESRLLTELPGGWVKKKNDSVVILTTHYPRSVSQYSALFESVERSISRKLLSEAKSDVEIIINDLPETFQSTEISAKRMLQAINLIRALSEGGLSITFSTPLITKSESKSFIIFTLSVVLGAMVGVIFY